MLEDSLNIGAFFYGGPKRAIDIADFSKEFLEHLEKISPWKRPFDVSGNKISTAEMPVHSDFSNFYDLLFLAWRSSSKVYYDSEGVRTLKFAENNTSPLGFAISFSNLLQSKKPAERVSIRISMGKEYKADAKGENLVNSVCINIKRFNEGEKNSSWSRRVTVEKIMLHLICALHPYECSAWSSRNTVSEIDGVILRHKFNWLTYIADREICAALSDNTFAREFEGGLWFEFGEEVDTVFDPNIRESAENIGRKIIEARTTR